MFEILEHRFDLIGSGGIFAETRLTENRHASVVGDPLKLIGEIAATEVLRILKRDIQESSSLRLLMQLSIKRIKRGAIYIMSNREGKCH